MEHTWAHWLRFRKNQFEGPCEDHVLAIKGHILAISGKRGLWDTPCIVKFGMEPSWAHWILIQEEPILRTMWEPYLYHERAIFWPFLGMGARGYTQQCEIWHGTSLGRLINIHEEPILRTMWVPSFGHKRATFWPFLGKGLYVIHPEL